MLCSFFLIGGTRDMSEDAISMAIKMFELDCQEARSRGERLGLLSEPYSWTENTGERALMDVSEKVEVHPYARAKWRERLDRQIARRDSVPACARTTPEAKESPSPETAA